MLVSVKDLRESPRTPGRYVVTLSDGTQCTVSVEALANAGATRIGAQLDNSRVSVLVEAGQITALVDRALNYLALGRRTRRELELRLRRVAIGKVPPEKRLINLALERLEARGVLSDGDVARAEAASRLRRGEAPARVRQQLRKKGVDAREADAAIAEAVQADGFDETAACSAAAHKKWTSLSSLEPHVARRRLAGFLQRRGFSIGVVHRVIKDVMRG